MTLEEMEDVANVIMETGTDGMIATNTTNARSSWDPLIEAWEWNWRFVRSSLIDKSTECIRTMYQLTDGRKGYS